MEPFRTREPPMTLVSIVIEKKHRKKQKKERLVMLFFLRSEKGERREGKINYYLFIIKFS